MITGKHRNKGIDRETVKVKETVKQDKLVLIEVLCLTCFSFYPQDPNRGWTAI